MRDDSQRKTERLACHSPAGLRTTAEHGATLRYGAWRKQDVGDVQSLMREPSSVATRN